MRSSSSALLAFLVVLAVPLTLAACGAAGATTDAGMDGSPSSGRDAGPSFDLSPVLLPVEPADPLPDPKCPVTKPAMPDLLDEALGLEGLDRCTYTFTGAVGSFYPSDAYRLPFFTWAHDHPVNAPSFARATIARLDAGAKSAMPVAAELVLLGNRLGPPLTVFVPQFALDAAHPLARAVAQLITDKGGIPDEAALSADAADVPLDLQTALATLVLAIGTADSDWNALVADFSSDDKDNLAGVGGLVLPGATSSPTGPNDAKVRMLLSKRWNEHDLVAGAARLAAAVERAHLARFAGTKSFAFDEKTPIGRIVLHDAADDTYLEDSDDAIALLVDTGGNDTYEKPVGAVGGLQYVGPKQLPIHVAVAVDLAGKDLWSYAAVPRANDGKRLPSDSDGRNPNPPISVSDQPRQGGARMGYGFVFDLGSEPDHYRSPRMSQGFGIAGVGVLYDAGGDDLYEGEAGVQGGGIFGVGLLLDAGGDDTYRTYSYAQGFGYTRGAGLLYDAAGSDKYLSDSGEPRLGGDPIYFSPQLPCSTKDKMGNRLSCGNSSFTQGVGFGRRDDTTHANMSGGLGILRDVSGDDTYTTSVFGQGSAYWVGTGILADGAGNDTYDGFWYVQGSAAHGGLCVFLDESGDDKYNQTWTMFPPYSTSIGQGHDFSVGWHLDLAGDDVYRAPNLSLGSGNANGAGAMINLGGTDTYVSSEPFTLGGAMSDPSAMRDVAIPTFGLFVHTGAMTTYRVPMDARLMPQPATGGSWSFKGDMLPIVDLSVGIDRVMGTVVLP